MKYRDRLCHSLVFSRKSFDDLRALNGDKAVWKLIEGLPEMVLRVDIDSDLPPDIDTPGDFQAEIDRNLR